MTEPVDQTHPVHQPPGTDTGPADPVAAPDRPGAGPPGRPSLGWTELVVGAVTYLVLVSVVLPVIIFLAFGMPGPDNPLTMPLLASSGLAALTAAIVAISLRVRWRPAIGLLPTTVRWLLLGIGAGLLAKVVGTGVSLGYIALTGDLSNPQEGIAGTAAGSGLELAGVLVFGALLVPIGEELLFRGIGYGALRGFGYGRLARYGLWIATILSAILFALAHGINLVMPAALILGLVNAVLYERSRSIWAPIASHVTFNASAFVFAAVALG